MLSETFKEKMRKIPSLDADALFEALETAAAVRGLRVNTVKVSVEEFLQKSDLPLTRLEYASDGFVLESDASVGSTPSHHAGEFYLQDPGAMATVNALDIERGFVCLDMCSAPGGKSSQIAAKIGDEGLLIANEFVPKRAKIAVGNFERLGLRNTMVTSLDTAELGELFEEYFDLVLADVPCSGEGMFRKSAEALSEWSEGAVLASAERALTILENGAKTVKRGGFLLHSTCTFSLEENEMVVDAFLKNHPDFKLVKVNAALQDCTSDGVRFEDCTTENIEYCRRFYPHLSRGEGQFIALMKRDAGDGQGEKIRYKDASRPIRGAELDAVRRFFRENMTRDRSAEVRYAGENLVLIPHGMPLMPRSVFCAGVLLGEIKKGILTPSHQFFSAYGQEFLRKENLSPGDSRVEKYLHGEEIDAKETDGSGWCAILYNGVTLGGAKLSGGRLKNHYPKGLRRP